MEIGKIEKACKQVYAVGLASLLYIACFDQIDTIPAPDADTHTISTDLTMRAADATATPPEEAGTFSAWKYSQKDQTWESEQDEESKMWTTTVQVFVPGVTSEKSHVLNNLGTEAAVVITKDKAGKLRIVGDTDTPCDITVKEQLTPKNGYIVTIKWMSSYSPYFYTGAIVE